MRAIYFLKERRRIMMTTTPTSTGNKISKVKRLRENGFRVFYLYIFWVIFCGGSFFYVFFKLIKFFIANNLVIAYKLSTIESFYYKKQNFNTILVFLGFCHNPGEIAKEEE